MPITEHKYYMAKCDFCGQPYRTRFNNRGLSILDGAENYYPLGSLDKQSLLTKIKASGWILVDGKVKCPECIKNPGEPRPYPVGGKAEHNSPVIVE